MEKLLISILLVTCYLLLSTPAHAQEEFSTSATAEYVISESGRTDVTHTITLTNKFSAIHAVSYSFVIAGVVPLNVKATEEGIELPTQVVTQNNETKILITFPKAVVGKDKSRAFTIEYYDQNSAVRNGQVWEIGIPKVEDLNQYQSYIAKLTVPKSFGEPAYLSPKPKNKTQLEDAMVYSWEGSQILETGVVAAFGQFQIFNFILSYHLKNPYRTEGQTEIALPPDTAFQRVYYEAINPNPRSINIDEAGNWLATYNLRGGEGIDVEVRGSAQLFSEPQDFYPKKRVEKELYLGSSEFWQVEDPDISRLGQQLKTPYAIYNYITDTLKYDYSRVRPDVVRLGAREALKNPDNAICMEFTDLFIALSRTAGIPAREVNGFAYTDNPELQPLSLVADVLHAWPEFWDQDQQVWIPVDPTWGATTGGVDYFSKFDLSHITFAIHGRSPNDPLPAGSYKLAGNPQKDVIVYFGNLPEKRVPNVSVITNVWPKATPFLAYRGKIKVKNDGPVALYNLPLSVQKFDGDIRFSQDVIPNLPPFSEVQIPFVWKTDWQEASPSFTILAGETKVSYTIPRELIIWQIIGVFVILIVTGTVLLSPLLLRKRILLNRGRTNDHEKSSHPHKWPWRLPFQKR